MNNVTIGMLASLAATVVLSVLMALKSMAGMLPQFNAVEMLAGLIGGGPIVGWLAHFAIGVILWGGLYGLLFEQLPGGGPAVKGLLLGAGAWLLMMVVFMPVAGAGFFGLKMGPPVAVATLVLHLIFGGVLGYSFGALRSQAGAA